MKVFWFFICLQFGIAANHLFSQAPESGAWGEQAEWQLSTGQELPEWQEETLLSGSSEGVALNRASVEELVGAGLCDELQAMALLEYRRAFGDLLTVYELRHVPLWDSATIFRALPLLRLGSGAKPVSLHQRLARSRKEALFRLSRRLGGSTAEDYPGSPDRMLLRLRLRHRDDLSIGLTLDKDPGEPIWRKGAHVGPDYVSAHFFVRKPKPWLKALALGDYEVRLGQGLILWQGGGWSLGNGPTERRRWSEPIRPHSGAMESGFFRGAAAHVKLHKTFDALVFFSRQKRDATRNEAGAFTTFRNSGYHRTESEIAGQKSLGETVAGAALYWRNTNANFSAYGLWTRYDPPIVPDSEALYRLFAFRGQQELLFGTEYVFTLKKTVAFGETVWKPGGGWGTLNGIRCKANDRLRLALSFRHFSLGFGALHGNPASRSGRSEAETGLNLAASLQLAPKWQMDGTADLFRFPFLRYQVGAPSIGSDWALHIGWVATRNLNFGIQVRHTEQFRDAAGTDRPESQRRLGLSFRAETILGGGLTWRARAEWLRAISGEASNMGYWLGQDLIWTRQRWALQARLALYHVGDFDARLYVYEHQVLYAFSAPAVQGDGLRYYLNARASLTEAVQIWLRVAQSVMFGNVTDTENPVDISLQFRVVL